MKPEHRQRLRVGLLGATILLLLGACAATPRVSVIRDPEADFSRFSSFGFREPLGFSQAPSELSGMIRSGSTGAQESSGIFRSSHSCFSSRGHTDTSTSPMCALRSSSM